jgi:hypothetical protein
MANKWLAHVKKTMKQMKSRGQYKKGDGLKKVILAAKKTYSKGKKGGAEDGEKSETDEESMAAPAPAAEGARRRRKTARKTRRLRK